MVYNVLKNLIKDVNTKLDTKDNKKIKNLYNKSKNDAIKTILKSNLSYYTKITSNFREIDKETKSGLVLDSINNALNKYNPKDVKDTYIKLSGTILRNKLMDKVRRLSNSEDVSNISYDKFIDEGFQFSLENGNFHRNKLNSIDKIEYKEFIMKSSITGIQKKILLMILESDGKITQNDIAINLGLSQPNISYHLNEIYTSYNEFKREFKI